jgi:uncharacterized lipoprotein YbaY
MTATVRGDVKLGPTSGSFSGAVLRIYLEDVSRADVAANVVAEFVVTGVEHTAGDVSLWPYEIQLESVDSRIHYALRAHVDRQGDGRVGIGDCVSTQSYPVLTFGAADRATVEVRQID